MILEQLDHVFAQTLVGDYDDELPWKAVHTLRKIGSRAVFERAVEWCGSQEPLKRARGADVLAQLGRTDEHSVNNFPDESYLIVSDLAQRERDPLPLLSAIHALGHIGTPLALPFLIANCEHENCNVRFAVTCALGNFANDPRAAQPLMTLMHDVDDDVRDWATFGLGVLGDLDSEAIRDALWQQMSDPNDDVREESLVGLGKRKDRRALPVLIAKLDEPGFSDRVIEAADAFLNEREQAMDRDPSEYVAELKKRLSL